MGTAFRLKYLRLLESKEDLDNLPKGKLLINTINAYSYNVALKDPRFAEALTGGDVLLPDGASVVLACRWVKGVSRPKDRIAGWDLFVHHMQRLNQTGGTAFFSRFERRNAPSHSEPSSRSVSPHQCSDLFAAIQGRILARGLRRDGCRCQRGSPRCGLDWHDSTQAGKMDLRPLPRARGKLPRGLHRCRVRLLCKNAKTCTTIHAGVQSRMALPTILRASTPVEKIYLRQLPFRLQPAHQRVSGPKCLKTASPFLQLAYLHTPLL